MVFAFSCSVFFVCLLVLNTAFAAEISIFFFFSFFPADIFSRPFQLFYFFFFYISELNPGDESRSKEFIQTIKIHTQNICTQKLHPRQADNTKESEQRFITMVQKCSTVVFEMVIFPIFVSNCNIFRNVQS